VDEAASAPARSPKPGPTPPKPGSAAPKPNAASSTAPAPRGPAAAGEFVPEEPTSLRETGMTDSELEALVLKMLLSRGDQPGRDIADQIKLPFILVEPLLRELKNDQLVVYRASAAMGDYLYQLTDLGRERARRFSEHCTYFGAAPVALRDYVASVKAQSLVQQSPTKKDLEQAFGDLLISPKMLARLGPALSSGRGMFLYGAPGNGKTSIAERVTRAFGEHIWIPRALGIDGDIIRLFDPVIHEAAPLPKQAELYDHSRIDARWVRIRRPTIVAGGELTMNNLEVAFNPTTGICEAPLQLKSNCGTLVIDDFGRQRISVDELMNRWIVPLEKRYDFLNLPKGKKVQVPFDQLIVFSTNLEPRDLVDEAFLRRIPYKIEVTDPTEDEFRMLLKRMCVAMQITYRQEAVDYLLLKHYKQQQRPLRCCHARDLLLQVRNFCSFHRLPLELNQQVLDFAVDNYFAVM
jgi:predicted ATPase with chaperone activity